MPVHAGLKLHCKAGGFQGGSVCLNMGGIIDSESPLLAEMAPSERRHGMTNEGTGTAWAYITRK